MLKDKIDKRLLEKFEAGLEPLRPELSKIPAKIIGYGEMSTVFVIDHPGQENIAYKRMPIFRSCDEMEAYECLFAQYNAGLRDIGINIPQSTTTGLIPDKGNMIIYSAQTRLPSESIGNVFIHTLDKKSLRLFILCVLRNLNRVFTANQARPSLTFGIDGQISNWAMKNYRKEKPVTEAIEVYYNFGNRYQRL